jgi:hypothetical protein
MRSILQIFFIAGLLFLQSCKKESNDIITQDNFNYRDFYYFYSSEKIPLYLLGTEVYVDFNVAHSTQEISNFKSRYSFFKSGPTLDVLSNYKRLIFGINATDTLQLQSFLIQLNQDSTINFAVPVFTTIKNNSGSFVIPLNEIICSSLISNDQLLELISHYDLTVIDSKSDDPHYLLKINKIVTGFEPLNLANSLYLTNKFKYVEPNFLFSLSFGSN